MAHARFVRFALVGAAMTLCNLALLALLVDGLGLHVLVACTVSFFVLNGLGYLLNKGFTFRLPPRPEWAEGLRYYAVMALSLAANLALMQLLVGGLGWHYLAASLVVTVLLAVLNYLGHAGFTFGGKAPPPAADTGLRVLQVSAFFPSHGGGIEVVAGQLAQRLPADGVQVHWLASGRDTDRPPARAGLAITAVPAWDPLEHRLGLPMPLWGPRGLLRLWRAMAACDLVQVHDYLYQPSLAAVAMAWLLDKPCVVTQHIGEISFKSPRPRALLEGLNRQLGARVLAHAARTLFVGAPVMQYFQQRTRFVRPPLLVPNGVDLQRFRPADDEPPASGPLRLLFVGRFVEKKGLPLLQACLDLAGVHFTFVGWGPLPPAAGPQVTLAGRLPPEAIVPLYQQADLLVLPSTGEGFPLVVQEALACGTPVLVSREVALAFPARDDACVFDVELAVPEPANALRQTLAALAADPARVRSARGAARALASQWSWDRCVQSYRSVYREALLQRTHGA
jgi:glycosyltransferase involved in cell wall biosynthesis/putative flippase GtrA